MIDGFESFRLGASWGSSHSLVSLAEPATSRSLDTWRRGEFIVRFHIGLECETGLYADLEAGLARLEQFG